MSLYRSLLPKESLVQVVPCLVQLLACEACVVHSYAATAIEKMMAIKVGHTQLVVFC